MIDYKGIVKEMVEIFIVALIIAGSTYHIVSGISEEPKTISTVALIIPFLLVIVVVIFEEAMFRVDFIKNIKTFFKKVMYEE